MSACLRLIKYLSLTEQCESALGRIIKWNLKMMKTENEYFFITKDCLNRKSKTKLNLNNIKKTFVSKKNQF